MPKGGVARAVQRESVAGDSGARTGLLVQLKEGASRHIPAPPQEPRSAAYTHRWGSTYTDGVERHCLHTGLGTRPAGQAMHLPIHMDGLLPRQI